MAVKLLVGVVVMAAAFAALLVAGRESARISASSAPGDEQLGPSPVTLAFSATVRASPVSEVFVVREDGSTSQLTHEHVQLEVGVWSPDMQRILVRAAWPTGQGLDHGLATVSLRTGEVKRLWRALGTDTLQGAAWSPIVGRIAFLGNGRLYVIAPNGADLQDLSPAGLTGQAEVSGLSLAPDGKQVAASVRLRCGSRIVVANLSSTWPARNVSGDCTRPAARAARFDDFQPSWSASGRIAFTRQTGLRTDLYEVDPSNGRPERYHLVGIGHPRSPVWSPASSPPVRLAIHSDNGLYLYDPTPSTGNLLRLTATTPMDGSVVWSPDASRIAFVSHRGTAARNLKIFDVEQPFRVIDVSGDYQDVVGQPAWRDPTRT
jgi:dipeptidyl aminopeptidase/acylaminoacyl peptidase